jgi:DHA3 family tetracycline resistance protein-like MFS transporter
MVFTTSYLYLTKELGLSDAAAVLLTTPLFVASLFAEIPTGILADHFGYKKSFATSILLYVAANFITFSTGNYPLLVAANIVLGIGMAFRSGAFDALCIENFKDNVKEYYANKAIIFGVVSIFIPIIAYLVAGALNYRAIFLIAVISGLINFLITVFLLKNIKEISASAKTGIELFVHNAKDIKKLIFNSPFLKVQMLITIIYGLSTAPINTFWPKIMAVSWGEEYNGIVFATCSFVSILAGLVAKRIKNEKLYYWFPFLIDAVCVFLITVLMGSWAAIPFFVIRSFSATIQETIYGEVINRKITSQRATVLSVFAFLFQIGAILSSLITGLFFANIGIRESWLFSSAILLVVTFMLFRQRRWLD